MHYLRQCRQTNQGNIPASAVVVSLDFSRKTCYIMGQSLPMGCNPTWDYGVYCRKRNAVTKGVQQVVTPWSECARRRFSTWRLAALSFAKEGKARSEFIPLFPLGRQTAIGVKQPILRSVSLDTEYELPPISLRTSTTRKKKPLTDPAMLHFTRVGSGDDPEGSGDRLLLLAKLSRNGEEPSSNGKQTPQPRADKQ